MIDQLNILNMDSVAALKTLPDSSVQLVVTSPPYDNLRTYGGHKWDFDGTAKELYRVVCGGGVVCWNVNDAVIEGSETLTSFRQAIYFKDACGFRVHDTMIYEKSNGSKPDQTRYNPCAEYVFVLSKGRLDRTDLTAREWMEHARAELLDGAVYLEKCIRLNGDCEWRNIGFNDRATGCDQGITLGASTEPPTFCPFCGRRIVYPAVNTTP